MEYIPRACAGRIIVQVKGRVGDIFNHKAHLAKTLDDVVALVAEVALEMDHFLLDQRRVEELHGCLLEGVVCAAVEIAATRSDAVIFGLASNDMYLSKTTVAYALMYSMASLVSKLARYACQMLRTLGSQDPSNSPAGKTEALGKPINNQDIVLVDILDILGTRNGGSVAVAGVVVARVELVADKGRASTANVLNLGQLGVGHDTARGVARVGGQNDRGTAGNFLCNLVGVDVVAVLFIQRDGNRRKLY